ncbi:Fic family protein [Treponema pedis]|uniref:Fic family protein n=1 Tax=Treponema pedis TaxID=409322 RepID=UPI003133FBD2
MSYKPPFTVTSKAIHLISEISAELERLIIRFEREDGIRLRKINRMKTIRGSLAIEGNSLTEEQVTALIEGKSVIAPLKEVQEVKNAIKVYEKCMSFNPYKEKDLLKAHAIMTMGLLDNPGHFRKTGVCIAGKNGISHVAPPADRVPFLMTELFGWLKNGDAHPLIKSSVFHYEFEFIHPFEDGNGRMGRLWQTRLLADWNPVFMHLPIENMILKNQRAYYKAIEHSTAQNDSGIFIDFILGIILKTIKENKKKKLINDTVNDTVNLILKYIKENPEISYDSLAEKTGKSRITISRKISELKKAGKIKRIGADKNGYWQIAENKI